MSAWATVIISGLVLVVAFMQWRTAHQKVMLDLFDRRYRIYQTISHIFDEVRNPDGDHALLESWSDELAYARFLFGPEVLVFLDLAEKRLSKLVTNMFQARQGDYLEAQKRNPYLDVDNDYKGKITHETWRKNAAEIGRLREELINLMSPYMSLNQKNVRSPFEWFKDRNNIRLSYADEKQK